MVDYVALQKRCQRGTTNLNDANNLLAECYGAIGELSARIITLQKELDSRHPFKPNKDEPTIGFTVCVICGIYTNHGGLQCPKLRPFSS
jgi:hypothetical protein